MALLQSLDPVATRFDAWKAGPWSMNHNSQILNMVFDQQVRHELLKNGLELAGEDPRQDDGVHMVAINCPSLSTPFYMVRPALGKTFKLRDYYMPAIYRPKVNNERRGAGFGAG